MLFCLHPIQSMPVQMHRLLFHLVHSSADPKNDNRLMHQDKHSDLLLVHHDYLPRQQKELTATTVHPNVSASSLLYTGQIFSRVLRYQTPVINYITSYSNHIGFCFIDLISDSFGRIMFLHPYHLKWQYDKIVPVISKILLHCSKTILPFFETLY